MTDLQPIEEYMEVFTASELQNLIMVDSKPCISLYMPTQMRGAEIEQNRIRFKNLVTKAREKLKAADVESQSIAKLIEPIESFEANDFWQHQSDGLAIFSAPNVQYRYRLPKSFSEQVIVGNIFYIRPLLPLVAHGERFYALTLKQDQVQLYEGSRYRIGKVDLKNVPQSLSEALKYDEFERQLQLHTGTQSAAGTGDAIFHGHGAASDDAKRKKNILRFFRELDNGIRDLLNEQQTPLILVGLDYLCALYRQANQYEFLVTNEIDVDPQTLDNEELHSRAWAIIEPTFEQNRQQALDRYHHLAGSDDERAADHLEQIIPAAHFQRIDTLFIDHDHQTWGTFDAQASQLEIHPDRQQGDDELLNKAAQQTLLHGGAVFTLDKKQLPGDESLAAILRY